MFKVMVILLLFIKGTMMIELFYTENTEINTPEYGISLQWRHNGRNGVSNPRRLDCLLNRLFKENIKAPPGFCKGNSPVTGDRWILLTKG